jgi:uncharacterized protein involved in cysteine biosynthesis
MNPEIENILSTLATKLQTTTEHLWDVLVVQARIEALTSFVIMCLWAAITITTFKVVKKKSSQLRENMDEELAYLIWVLWLLYAGFVAMYVSSSITNVVAALFNPEYWALKEILNAIG